MKTAIILVGNIRTWDICKENFIKTFNHLNPDIFVSTYKLQYGYHPHIQGVIGNSEDNLLNFYDIVNKFNELNVKCVYVGEYNKKTSVNVHPQFAHLSSNCFEQYKTFNRGIEYMIDYEKFNNFEYDVIIKTRCDICYNKIDLDCLNDNTIIIDNHNIFPNDCIFISTRDIMIDISNFMINEFFSPLYTDSHLNPPHGLLHNAIKNKNLDINLQDIMKCVVRKNNIIQHY